MHTHTHTHTYIYIHTHTHIYIYTHTYIHTYIHTHIHKYIYTHIYKVITQLKIDTYSDKSKHCKGIRIKLHVYKTVIKPLTWQITKMYKRKALKHDLYIHFQGLIFQVAI